MSALIRAIDGVNIWVGEKAKWLTTVLVILVFADAMLRYLFSTSKAWLTDLEWHTFALIFLLGAAATLRADQHVRVDIFYSKWTVHRKAWVNLLGTIVFLIPWCLLVIYASAQYAEHAFTIGERSAEPGGLAARWIIKGAISLGFVLLLLQAVGVVLRSLSTLRSSTSV